MRIVFSTDQIYLHGGIEKVMTQKANYFADILGYEVIVLTTEQGNRKPCYQLSTKIKLVDIGINYQRDQSYFSRVNLAKIPRHFKQTKMVLNKFRPDVVIVLNFAFDFYWLPFISRRIPKWKEFHSSRYFEMLDRKNTKSVFKMMRFRFSDWIESQYTKIIVLNPDEKKYYRNDSIAIIPNPIEIPTSSANLINKKVITAGRIAPVKGFENAILTWKLVNASHPNWELHIYGNGEPNYVNELQQLIADNKLQHTVFIKNAVADLQKQMLDYSLYLMTSHTECFPMVLLEALSTGLPILSFDCPTGPHNIVIHEKDGFLVEDQNNLALADKLIFLIENEKERITMGREAKQNVQRFETTITMKKWLELLIDLQK